MSGYNLLSYEDWLIQYEEQIEIHVTDNRGYDREDVISAYYDDYVSWYKGAYYEQ